MIAKGCKKRLAVNKEIAGCLNEVRVGQGLTYGKMGGLIGVTSQQVSKIIKNQGFIKACDLLVMARHLGMGIESFFPSEDEPAEARIVYNSRALLELMKEVKTLDKDNIILITSIVKQMKLK